MILAWNEFEMLLPGTWSKSSQAEIQCNTENYFKLAIYFISNSIPVYRQSSECLLVKEKRGQFAY